MSEMTFIRRLVSVYTCQGISDQVDAIPADQWVDYNNACERKRTSSTLPEPAENLAETISEMASKTSMNLGITDPIHADPELWGAGIHQMRSGDFLGPHIDYAAHPDGKHERRLNAIAFLNDDFIGGDLLFLDDRGEKVIHRITPRQGDVIFWESTDTAFHAVEKVDSGARNTLALYFLSPIREGVTRKRALFIPPR